MKHLTAVLVVAAVIALTGITSAAGDGPTHPIHHPLPRTCTAQAFKPFSAAVWSPKAWERGNPPPNVLEALRKREACAPGPHRKVMKLTWAKDRSEYFAHRHHMKWLAKYRHYEYPDGSHWAVPYPIAWCESGGDYYASSAGAYGEIPPLPQYQPPKVQDEIAVRLFHESGEEPWAPYEGECPYR
jgi:hypothetical protein